MTIEVEVRYFAAVRERLATASELVTLDVDASVDALWHVLLSHHPALDVLRPHLRTAVNDDFVGDGHTLRDGDVVALIPPVAGGTGRAELTDQPLDLESLMRRVRVDRHGAVASFVGVVRNHSKGREVSYLEYEAYESMALAKLEAIADEVTGRWPDCAIVVAHRVGRLEVGDAAVAIAASAPHRKEAFRACEHMIDRIKEIVPIWKKEVGPDGSEWVGMGS